MAVKSDKKAEADLAKEPAEQPAEDPAEEPEAPAKEPQEDDLAKDAGADEEEPPAEAAPPAKDEPAGDKPRKKKGRAKAEEAEAVPVFAKPVGASDAPEWQPRPMVSPKTAWALATLSLVLCPISFAGFDVWPLSFIAWVPLIIALRGQTPKRAALLGWYAGFGMTMFGFYWLINMLEVFSGFGLPLCILFAAILCAQKGGRIALLGWLYARGTQRGWHHALVFLAAFAATELAYPVLFPWYFGAAMHNTPLMMQTADIGGPIFVSVVILAVNVAVAELAEKPLFGLQPDRRTMIGGAVTLVFALGYGAWRMSSVDAAVATAPSLKVGMIQNNEPLPTAKHDTPRPRYDGREVHLRRNAELRKQGVDLVVWSEGALWKRYEANGYEDAMRREVTRNLKVPTIMGAVIFERLTDKSSGRAYRAFNTALMADAQGNITGRYDKQFLLMFGEYLPLGETFPILYKWSPHSSAFTPGTSFKPLTLGDHRISTMICYEDISPGFVAKLVSEGDPELLVNITNDTWFGDTAEPWQHLALAKFRSVEHRKYLVRVTNSGVSAIVDPVGRVIAHTDTMKEDVLVGDVRYMKLGTIFSTLGEKPWWAIALLVVAAAFVKRKR